MEHLRIIKDEEVTDENVVEALRLDYANYEEKYHLEDEKCIFYHRKNPMIYTMLLDEKEKVVGYINVSPVRDEAYDRLRLGEIDNFLTYQDLEVYQPGKAYNIYLSSIVVHPKYRHQHYATKMIKVAFEKLKNKEIHIRRILGDAVTEEGANLAKKLGLEPIGNTDRGSVTYEKIGEPVFDFGE